MTSDVRAGVSPFVDADAYFSENPDAFADAGDSDESVEVPAKRRASGGAKRLSKKSRKGSS